MKQTKIYHESKTESQLMNLILNNILQNNENNDILLEKKSPVDGRHNTKMGYIDLYMSIPSMAVLVPRRVAASRTIYRVRNQPYYRCWEQNMIFLIIQAIENDEQRKAVEHICDLYYKNMMKIALDILKHKQDAEDAVQDAFYNISVHADLFLDTESNATIARVSVYTRNAAINIYNRKKKTNELFSLPDVTASPSNIAIDEETLDRILESEEAAQTIRSAINQLGNSYRDVIMMKYFYHYRNLDIAKVMNTDANDIAGKIFRAKQKLRKILQDKI